MQRPKHYYLKIARENVDGGNLPDEIYVIGNNKASTQYFVWKRINKLHQTMVTTEPDLLIYLIKDKK